MNIRCHRLYYGVRMRVTTLTSATPTPTHKCRYYALTSKHCFTQRPLLWCRPCRLCPTGSLHLFRWTIRNVERMRFSSTIMHSLSGETQRRISAVVSVTHPSPWPRVEYGKLRYLNRCTEPGAEAWWVYFSSAYKVITLKTTFYHFSAIVVLSVRKKNVMVHIVPALVYNY